ncbi:MAG: hypothetical protein IJ498_09095 [Akkermansia sp.]|nr:hypothetical protein [Akkermansia sp.]
MYAGVLNGENNTGRLPTPRIAQSTLKLHEKEHLHSRWQEPALAGYLNVETPQGELSFKSFLFFFNNRSIFIMYSGEMS